MKKIILLILAFVLCFSLVACGGGKSEPETEEKSPSTIVSEKAERYADTMLSLYGFKAIRTNVTTIRETSENEFKFYGTYDVMDVYNDSYEGTFSGTGKYNVDTQSASVDVDFDFDE